MDNLENNNIPSTNRTETTSKTNPIKNNESIDLLPVKNSSSLAILPILLALLPPLLAFFLGMEDLWSDLFLLILVIFYLYNLIQLPWDFYLAARKKRFINPIDLTMYNQNENLPADASSEALRYQAQYRLWWYEKISFLMVIISPILGGYIFLIARSQLTNLDTFVSDFNLLLFILAAEVRPMVHLGQLLTNSANELQQVVSHQTAALQSMQFRLQGLENQMDQLRQAFATKQDISKVKNQFEPPLNQLSQLVMRQYCYSKTNSTTSNRA
ncbi:hypothetical protein K502DRAFT_325338 [Neoconidiobolus thromboides FSU 785]|nr:hypothetical protein K502DRAFT_325338 [Neoconidiobolus thromboides FSU 785]